MNHTAFRFASPMRPHTLLSLLIGLLLLMVWLLAGPHDYGGAPAVEFTLRAAPPPEVAIELSDAQLRELTEAYEHGFDHPDPGGEDPCERLRLLPHKKLSAWRRQFRKRGFTMEKVRDMLRTGRREVYTHPTKGNRYTKIYDARGNWIVVDFVDCIVWQVAPYNFK